MDGISSDQGSESSPSPSSKLQENLTDTIANKKELGEPFSSYELKSGSFLLKKTIEKDQTSAHLEACIGESSKQQILQILGKISQLKPSERLLLYLRLPGGSADADPLRQPQNPLGTRSEINHTINWVRSHLENDPNVSIPKQDVYNDYIIFCNRVLIKPLSTADFGKVMKQVFPSLRPRRLGTRGHSRYCYAAMRKATKLDVPHLPDIRENNNNSTINDVPFIDYDNESWNTVKTWAETLFNIKFSTMKDLAIHVKNLPFGSSVSTEYQPNKRTVLLKPKDRSKKLVAASIKKRKKRKRKFSACNNDSSQKTLELPCESELDISIASGQIKTIKTEIDYDQEEIPTVANKMLPYKIEETASKTDPVKLDPGSENPQKTIAAKNPITDNFLDTTNYRDNPKNCLFASSNDKQKPTPELEEVSFLLAAASSLRLISSNVASNNALVQSKQKEMTKQKNETTQPSDVRINLAKRTLNKEAITAKSKKSKAFHNVRDKTECDTNIVQKPIGPVHNQTAGASTDDKEDFTNDFIIPRERVISICNLDKDALDDYLYGGENSQEQEAELLQYFQFDAEQSTQNNENSANQVSVTSTSTRAVDKKSILENQEQLLQLRQYLQQNLQTNSNPKTEEAISGSINNCNNPQIVKQYPIIPSLKAASYGSSSISKLQYPNAATAMSNQGVGIKRSCKDFDELYKTGKFDGKNAPHSPNTRRRNFSFVPISSGPHSPGYNTGIKYQPNKIDVNPFVCPKQASAVKRPYNKRVNVSKSLPPLNLSNQKVINNTGDSYRTQQSSFATTINRTDPVKTDNMISSSAPPSPSLVQSYNHRIGGHALIESNSLYAQQNALFTRPVAGSRSQSVPLHFRSPIFNLDAPPFSSELSSSAYSSVAQTPVPSEYTDFNDPYFMEFLAADPNELSHDTANDKNLSDNHNLSSTVAGGGGATATSTGTGIGTGASAASAATAISSSYSYDGHSGDRTLLLAAIHQHGLISNNSSSRSVPSTPVPLICTNLSQCYGNFNNNSKLNVSKSVPTTPVRAQHFRYYTETNRDVLINGNIVECGAVKQQTNNILSNQDEQCTFNKSNNVALGISNEFPLAIYSEDADPLVGSDLLNAL